MALSKQNRPAVAEVANAIPEDTLFSTEYPTLWDHITQDRWDDGTPRQTSSFLVFRDGGVFKAMLRDRDAGLCLWIAVQRPLDLFPALEAALNNPQADWRTDRQQQGQTAKRVKRSG